MTRHDSRDLALLDALAQKVARVHGEHNPKLRALAADVHGLCDSLDDDLDPTRLQPLFERVRSNTDDYVVPEWGCSSYRALFRQLADLESGFRGKLD